MPTNLYGGTHLPTQTRSDVGCDDPSECRTARLSFDIPDALLAEVDFKWLMAGQGLRVDPKRFYADPVYTMDLLQTGLRSESSTVRACAGYLLQKIESASMLRRPPAIDSEIAVGDMSCMSGSRPASPTKILSRQPREAERHPPSCDRGGGWRAMVDGGPDLLRTSGRP